MDKIDGTFNSPFLPRKEERKPRKAGEAAPKGFLGLLRPAEAAADEAPSLEKIAANEAEIEALLDEVHGAGQDLAQYPSPENIQLYKKKIARFIQMILTGSVELTEIEGRMRKDMKKPKYALLQVIDERLDKLGAYVLQTQKDKLEILRKVDELHGLLVDLRH